MSKIRLDFTNDDFTMRTNPTIKTTEKEESKLGKKSIFNTILGFKASECNGGTY